MEDVFDVIVVGLGAHGSAAAAHLAKRGQRVLGVDQFKAAHSEGSSHGRSRIIRLAYFEDPRYVPLLRRSFTLWHELQAEADRIRAASSSLPASRLPLADAQQHAEPGPLLTMTGGLMVGPASSTVVAGVLACVAEHKLPHRLLTPAQVRQQFPEFQLAADDVAVYEEQAGYLDPERCIAAHLRVAELHGACLHFEERVTAWSSSSGAVQVHTHTGRRYQAKQLALCAGAWAPELYGSSLRLPLTVERRVLFWFQSEAFRATPIYIWDTGVGPNFYGFPRQPGSPDGVKVAMHYPDPSVDTTCTPATVDRCVRPAEIQQMRQLIADRLPSLNGQLVATATCIYTKTPNEHFLVAHHPRHHNVLLVSACSGHGFKFASVIGEIVADLLVDNRTAHDISLFSLAAHDWKIDASL